MSLLKRLLLTGGMGGDVIGEPDFELQGTYGLRYSGYEGHYSGTYGERTT